MSTWNTLSTWADSSSSSSSSTWSDIANSTEGHAASLCRMNMLFTWQTDSICIVFQWWRMYNRATVALSFLGIVGLGVGYELVRELTRRYESYINSVSRGDDQLLPLIIKRYMPDRSMRDRLILSFLYAFQVLYSFFLMLVFMSYNGWMMFAVVVGAFIGFFFFGSKHRVPTGESAVYYEEEIAVDIKGHGAISHNSELKHHMTRPVGVSAVRGGTCH
ncbi:Ctr copper transporter family-domain-containing protein [Myxozyma melibiosi]|uniref:Copper transport protein n=1 Tax=Myxozyma melibiosi TaxID=54550 RepID=A0ABR1F613_9ASCO